MLAARHTCRDLGREPLAFGAGNVGDPRAPAGGAVNKGPCEAVVRGPGSPTCGSSLGLSGVQEAKLVELGLKLARDLIHLVNPSRKEKMGPGPSGSVG